MKTDELIKTISDYKHTEKLLTFEQKHESFDHNILKMLIDELKDITDIETRIILLRILIRSTIEDKDELNTILDSLKNTVNQYSFKQSYQSEKYFQDIFSGIWNKNASIIKFLEILKETKHPPKDEKSTNAMKVANDYLKYLHGEKETIKLKTLDFLAFAEELEDNFLIPKDSISSKVFWYNSIIFNITNNPKKLKTIFSPDFLIKDIDEYKIMILNKITDLDLFNELISNEESKKQVALKFIHLGISAKPLYSKLSSKSLKILKKVFNREKFDRIFKDALGTDSDNRKDFWKNYIDSMEDLYYSPHPENILIMAFNEIFAIEFLNSSNACYFYDRKKLESYNGSNYNITKLKNSIDIVIKTSDAEGSTLNFKKIREKVISERVAVGDFKLITNILGGKYQEKEIQITKLGHFRDFEIDFKSLLKQFHIKEDKI